MKEPSGGGIVFRFLGLIVLVVVLSLVSVSIRGGKSEKVSGDVPLIFEETMTLDEFVQKNNLPKEIVKKIFNLTSPDDLKKKISQFNLPREEISTRVNQALALAGEEESKNWILIPVKFAAWIIFLALVFRLMRREKITPKTRQALYLTASFIFGVVLGADPSSMGTVKDAIVLYGAKGVIFPPRLIALTVFLIMVFLANKFICAWGCQVGTLQDLIFRLNRRPKDNKGIWPQYKPPFALTNTVRVVFFVTLTALAFTWAFDMIDPIDPFKIYKPAVLGLGGAVFIGALLVLSLFIYRPWCHLFCPFGLLGWLVEKISLFKIQVDYQTCIACETCARACPSTVMNAILKRERLVIPDCFSCATCIDVCPTDSIHFRSGKRTKPPADKFKPKAQAASGNE